MITVGELLLWALFAILLVTSAVLVWRRVLPPIAREAATYFARASARYVVGAVVMLAIVAAVLYVVPKPTKWTGPEIEPELRTVIFDKTGDLLAQLKGVLPDLPSLSAPNVAVMTHGERIVPLFYAPSRSVPEKPILTEIGFARGNTLSYGRAMVRVPDDHRPGKIERPHHYILGWILVYGWVTYDEPESEKRHFVVKGLQALSQNEFVRALSKDKDKSALIFVHGFNTTFEEALYRTAQIVWDMKFYEHGPAITFSWASQGGIVKYDYDTSSALAARKLFLQLLDDVGRKAGVSKIFVIAHSMGNMVVADALATAVAGSVKPAELIMAAPDIDRDLFAKDMAKGLSAAADKITLYASSNDRALLASMAKADYPRAGYVPAGGPVVVDGVETVDVSSIGVELFGLNHDTFAGTRELIEDMGKIFYQSVHPPDKRSQRILPMPESPAQPRYWSFTKKKENAP